MVASSLISILISSCVIVSSNAAFVTLPHHHQNNVPTKSCTAATCSSMMLMMSTTSSKGEATGEIKLALKKMRGISVSVEYKPAAGAPDSDDDTAAAASTSSTDMEMEILSQELRKAKAASIWTSNLDAVEQFAKEQVAAKGNFPGPCPVVYDGDDISAAIEKGANAIVLEMAGNFVDNVEVDFDVDVICKVKNTEEIQQALDAGFEYAFLLPGSDTYVSNEELQDMLCAIPKNSVVIASLPGMQDDSAEIARGKELGTIHSKSDSDSSKVSGILIQDACVGDAEDLKYTAFVVESINKKSSSTFQMTGLTGAANGHFGSELSGGLQSAKWRRKGQ